MHICIYEQNKHKYIKICTWVINIIFIVNKKKLIYWHTTYLSSYQVGWQYRITGGQYGWLHIIFDRYCVNTEWCVLILVWDPVLLLRCKCSMKYFNNKYSKIYRSHQRDWWRVCDKGLKVWFNDQRNWVNLETIYISISDLNVPYCYRDQCYFYTPIILVVKVL